MTADKHEPCDNRLPHSEHNWGPAVFTFERRIQRLCGGVGDDLIPRVWSATFDPQGNEIGGQWVRHPGYPTRYVQGIELHGDTGAPWVANDDHLLASILRKLWVGDTHTCIEELTPAHPGRFCVSVESVMVDITPEEAEALRRIDRD